MLIYSQNLMISIEKWSREGFSFLMAVLIEVVKMLKKNLWIENDNMKRLVSISSVEKGILNK
jgi:hypothetical protein